MKRLDLQQKGDHWLKWRRTLVTASDAASIMGVSPYCSEQRLWEKKLGIADDDFVNDAMKRGVRDEPIARQMFIDTFGIHVKPCCIESDEYNFLGASLDGIDETGTVIIEIKSQRIDKIKKSGIPAHHMLQMQHQIMCGDGRIQICYYVSIWESEIYVIKVQPDLILQKKYLDKAEKFWRTVVFCEKPAGKYLDRDDELWKQATIECRQIDEQLSALEQLKKNNRQKIIELCQGNNCQGFGVKVLKKNISGRVDYSQIPELQNVDLNKYKKKPLESWVIMIE